MTIFELVSGGACRRCPPSYQDTPEGRELAIERMMSLYRSGLTVWLEPSDSVDKRFYKELTNESETE